jgi:hypothetical protein
MLPPHIEPPYWVAFINDQEAALLAGDQILARFNGGWDTPVGHANACFFARAGASYQILVDAVKAAQTALFELRLDPSSRDDLREQLDRALRSATSEPKTSDRAELERRRQELRIVLAEFLGKPRSLLGPITNEQGRLLGELEDIDFLLGS